MITLDVITPVTIDQFKLILKTAPTDTAIFLWGSPGVGKTDAIRQVALQMQAELHYELLSTKQPEDFEGVPFTREVGGNLYTYFAPPYRFHTLVGDDGPRAVLFLDELNTAPAQVQVVAMQMALGKRVGDLQLGRRVLVVAAGNLLSDRAAVFALSKPLQNRWEHYRIITDADVWVKWALANGIDPTIIGYIRSQPAKLMNFDPDSASPSFATPRTYEMLDRRVKEMGWDDPLLFKAMSGCVGEGVAHELAAYRNLRTDLPDPRDILDSPRRAPVPDGPDRCYFVLSSLVAHVLRSPSYQDVVQSLFYVTRMSPELGVKYCRDILTVPGDARNALIRAVATNSELKLSFNQGWSKALTLLQEEYDQVAA